MSYQYVKTSRKNLKNKLLYIMGNKCCICGYDKCPAALEFHHKNPEEKSFTISANSNIGFERANEEIKKCILVCSNCHREIHAFNLDVSQYNCYDEQKASEKRQELEDIKTHKLYYCKDCGKVITAGALRCPECAALASRTCERPDRDTLKFLIRTKSFVSIGQQYNVTDNAIRKWCDSYNLPRKKAEISKYTDEEWADI